MQAPPFWHTPYPFSDFLVYSTRGEALGDRVDAIRKGTAAIGMKDCQLPQHDGIASHVITAGPDTGGSPEFAILSGSAQKDGVFYFGPDSISSPAEVDALAEGVGLFTSVHSDKRRIRVTQDFFGYGTLYYFSSSEFFAVSNRYHLLLMFLSWAGHRGRLDPTKVLANLFSNKVFFRQNMSHNMDIAGVRQLPFDHEIEVDGKGWRIVPRPRVQDALAGRTDDDLAELVRRGSEEVVENVRAVVEADRFSKIVTDLSGGVDSRAVLGAILNIDGARDRVEVRTADYPPSRDLEIATGLRNLFNLRYYTEQGRPQLPMTLTECLDVWRSYFMGTYHRAGRTEWSPQGQNIGELRLSGGSGEVYRAPWCYDHPQVVADAETINDIATRLIDHCSPAELLGTSAHQRMVGFISRELAALPGKDPVDQFENHYIFFGNRYHFGMRAYELFHDSPMWFPLMSKSMFAASRTIPALDRKDMLMLRLTDRLHPLLIWIDYDSVETAKNPILPTLPVSDPRFANCAVALNSDTTEWEAVEKQNIDMLHRSRQKMDQSWHTDWARFDGEIYAQAQNAIALLRSIVPDPDGAIASVLSVTQAELAVGGMRETRQIYSKLTSLVDQAIIFSG